MREGYTGGWALLYAILAEPVPGLGTVILTGVIRDRLGHFVDLIQKKVKIVSGREPDGDPCSEPASAPWAFHRSNEESAVLLRDQGRGSRQCREGAGIRVSPQFNGRIASSWQLGDDPGAPAPRKPRGRS
jgi:hypothetical protein